MQYSQHIRKVTPKSPRRARRGALMPAALLAVLLITILMTAFAEAQLRKASAARTEARAVQLAAIAADFDYYVHKNRGNITTDLTLTNTAGRELTDIEQDEFYGRIQAIGVSPQLPGFTLTYLVGRIVEGDDSGGDDGDIYGGLLLSASATNSISETEMDTLIAKLATYGAQANSAEDDAAQDNRPQGGVLDRASFVQNVRGRALTGSERVILTAPLSGLDPKYVLRERRAGHPPPKLVAHGPLDMNGNNVLDVGTLTVTGQDTRAASQAIETLRTTGLKAENLETLNIRINHLKTEGCTGC